MKVKELSKNGENEGKEQRVVIMKVKEVSKMVRMKVKELSKNDENEGKRTFKNGNNEGKVFQRRER